MTVTSEPAAEVAAPAPARRGRLVVVLTAVLAVALVVLGGALAVVTGVGRSPVPGDASVDAGFARDMITHHDQAVQMAQVVRDHGTDPALRLLAFDIETQQLAQLGQLRGWLESWGVSEQTDRAHLAWMSGEHVHLAGSGMLMPGMATSAELAKLRSLSGRLLAVLFLQLMIRHHQGGISMAQYAAEHADMSYPRRLAQKIVAAQSAEVVTMEQLLRERGGEPLPPSA